MVIPPEGNGVPIQLGSVDPTLPGRFARYLTLKESIEDRRQRTGAGEQNREETGKDGQDCHSQG